jgi:hypothetical protein
MLFAMFIEGGTAIEDKYVTSLSVGIPDIPFLERLLAMCALHYLGQNIDADMFVEPRSGVRSRHSSTSREGGCACSNLDPRLTSNRVNTSAAENAPNHLETTRVFNNPKQPPSLERSLTSR